jgi:hypothetical protein
MRAGSGVQLAAGIPASIAGIAPESGSGSTMTPLSFTDMGGGQAESARPTKKRSRFKGAPPCLR